MAKETLSLLSQEHCIFIDGDMEDVDANVRASSLGAAASEYYLTYRSPKQMQFGLQECAKMLTKELRQNPKGSKENPTSLKLRPLERSKRTDEISIAWLLYTIACTHEFDELPVRHNEEILNEELSKSLTWGPDTSRVLSPNGRPSYIDPEVYAQPHTK